MELFKIAMGSLEHRRGFYSSLESKTRAQNYETNH